MHANIIIDELKSFATEDRRKTNEWFFKTGPGEYSEHDQFIGVRMPQIRGVAKKYFKVIKFNEINRLISHPVHEIRHCALIILVNKYQSGNKEEVFNYYLNNLGSVNNWDLVDTTSPHIIGNFIFTHQEKISLLYEWENSNNLWERRIAIVSTSAFIRHGEFTPTLKISKLLLNDQQDLIHKAVGWMLREVYKKDEAVVKLFLRENYAQLPRTTLRYAIERMQEDERQRYLKGIF
jgi:3-methyladenine DNA glycosylase AlkD